MEGGRSLLVVSSFASSGRMCLNQIGYYLSRKFLEKKTGIKTVCKYYRYYAENSNGDY